MLFANICFCNFAYLEGYDDKVISKLPNEIDERKYLDQFNKVNEEDIKNAIQGNNKDGNNIIIDETNELNENNEKETEEGVIPSEIYGVSHGQFVEMKKQNQINTKSNKNTNTTTINNKNDNKKPTVQNKKSNVIPKKDNVNTSKNISKNTKSNYATSKYTKGKFGKK